MTYTISHLQTASRISGVDYIKGAHDADLERLLEALEVVAGPDQPAPLASRGSGDSSGQVIHQRYWRPGDGRWHCLGCDWDCEPAANSVIQHSWRQGHKEGRVS